MKKELHLASSVEALNALAQKNIKNIKPDKLYNSAEKLFQTGLQTLNDGDEETAYILFVRFVLIYKFLDEVTDDKRYTKQRLGREYVTISEQLGKLESSLNIRYKEEKKEEVIIPVLHDPPKVEIKNEDTAIKFPNGYITCNDLYKLINKKMDIVILDSRPRDDYLQSSMKHPSCVNIPEQIIQSGSSANTLGKQVPNDSKSQWDRRWKSSLTILLDWSSTKETITASKLSVLKDILVHWDTTMIDSKPPVILNGGYLEWLQMYPMLCTNPDVVYEVQNSVLNDLLDLDSIEYPSAEETIPARYLKPPSLQQPVIDRATKPSQTDKGKSGKGKQDKANDSQDQQAKRSLAEEVAKRLHLEQRLEKHLEDKAALEKTKKDLDDENEQLRRQLFNITSNTDLSSKPKETNKTEKELRDRLLREAREKKNNLLTDTALLTILRAKVIDSIMRTRSSGRGPALPGLTGLTNLGSTCYMNSVLQIYSNTRLIHNYFVYGVHPDGTDYTEKLGDLCTELRNAFIRIWTGNNKYFSPGRFKAAVDRHGPRYKGREQQDAHEFLIALNTWVHDDVKRDITRPRQVIWTPRQKNWVACTEGKTSIVLETFCGQQMNIISCDECHKRKEKLELFENISLALPDQPYCTLEDCLNKYFSKQQIHDYNCQTCKSNKAVTMEVQLVGSPPVLVLCLKRFTEEIVDGSYNFVKSMNSVKYPLVNLNLYGSMYNLYGVIVHRTSGTTLDSGHYFSIVRNLYNNKWYKYDDQHVTEVTANEALEPTDAYLLFYQSEMEEKMCKEQFRSK